VCSSFHFKDLDPISSSSRLHGFVIGRCPIKLPPSASMRYARITLVDLVLSNVRSVSEIKADLQRDVSHGSQQQMSE
jgi:hypothetical protein